MRRPDRLSVLAALAVAGIALALGGASFAGGNPEETPAAPAPPRAAAASADPCASAVAYDDGEVDTGYGFVPSSEVGLYVQAFDAADFPRRELATVCACWLRTRVGDRVDFDVVFFADEGGRPAAEPYFHRSASATGVPDSVAAAGRFTAVDVAGVRLPEGRSWIGVRWDPGASSFAFVCADKGEGARPVFFHDDREPQWQSVFDSKDPNFQRHRAIGVRAVAATADAPAQARPAASAPATFR